MSTTIEHDGFSITSNTESEAAMREALGTETTNGHTQDDGAAAGDEGRKSVPERADSSLEESGTGTVDGSGQDDGAGATGSGERSEGRVAKPAKPRDNPQARISQAIAKQHEAERKAADLESRLAALEQARQTPDVPRGIEPTAPAKAESTGKPSWKTFEAKIGQRFESWADAQDAYVDARDEWKDGQQRDVVARQAKQTAGQEHVARVTAFKATHADYDTVVQAVADIAIGPVLETAILALPNSADVVYWLATHPDAFAQLAAETQTLDVTAAPIVRQLLDARVGAGARSGAAPGAELSKARPPVRPVGVSSVIVPDDPDDSESFDAYFKRQNSIDRKKGKL